MRRILECILLSAVIILGFPRVASSGVIRPEQTQVCVPLSSERLAPELLRRMEFMLRGFFKDETERLFVKKGIAVYNFDTDVTFCLFPIARGNDYVGVFDFAGGEAVISNDASVCDALSRLTGGNYIVYIREGEYCAQSDRGAIRLSGADGFASSPIPVNKDYFLEKSGINILNPCPIKGLKTLFSAVPSAESENIPRAYVITCGISDYFGQGDLPLCWAASAATIVDHVAGKDYTAETIAERFGYPTDYGQDMSEALGIIRTYDPKYFNINGKITWIRVKKLVKKGYPFYMHLCYEAAAGVNATSYHAVVGCGCFFAADDADLTFVTAWNPQGKGNLIAFRYSAEDFSVTSNGKKYRWTKTLAR